MVSVRAEVRDENDWVELLRDRDTRIADLEQYEARNHELAEQLADMTAQWLDVDIACREHEARVDELEVMLDEVTTRWRDTVVELCDRVATEDGGK